jgi:hypothetical protein
MFRAGTGRKGTFTHVQSIFLTVRFRGVEIAAAAGFSGAPPMASAPAAALVNKFRLLSLVFIECPGPRVIRIST